MYFKILLTCFVLLIGLGCSKDKEMQNQTYVITLGQDTVGVESFVRNDSLIKGVLIQRIPQTMVAKYKIELDQKNRARFLEVNWESPKSNPDAIKPYSYSIAIVDTAASIHRWGNWSGNEIDTTILVPVQKNTLPLISVTPFSIAVFEQAVIEAKNQPLPSDSIYSISTIHPRRNRAIDLKFELVEPNKYAWYTFGYPVYGEVNNDNELQWFSAEESTIKFKSRKEPRHNTINVEALASHFGKLDAEGNGFGQMSGRGQVEVTIDEADIKVDYGRPYKRGRKIWDGLVPYNEVWRTGSNLATHFTTSKDLLIGGKILPADTYTLFSIYSADQSQLIINKQTKQWGTSYDQSQDLYRLEMKKENLNETIQQFTIEIVETEAGGAILLEWDKNAYRVAFQVDE